MAEKIVSPGVFTNEIDASFLPAAIAELGAVIVGPTVKGPALVPTEVNSFSEYEAIFGTTFESGSGATEDTYTYLTSLAARQYLQHNDTLTVVRVLAGDYSGATSIISSSVDPDVLGLGTTNLTAGTFATGAIEFYGATSGTMGPTNNSASFTFRGTVYEFIFTGSHGEGNTTSGTTHKYYVTTGSVATTKIEEEFAHHFNNSASFHKLPMSASFSGSGTGATTASMKTMFTASVYGSWTHERATSNPNSSNWSGSLFLTTASAAGLTGSFDGDQTGGTTAASPHIQQTLGGGVEASMKEVFKLHTRADGGILNSGGDQSDANVIYTGSHGVLVSGSKDNFRYEVTSLNKRKGTFSLAVRRGNDLTNQKQIIENYTNISLDPKASNYIGKAIGDMKMTIRTDEDGNPFLQPSGSYPNKSKHVYVEVLESTIDYLDENGDVRIPAASASLPTFFSGSNSGSRRGSFAGGSDGAVTNPKTFYEKIEENSSQGLDPSNDGADGGYNDYIQALSLLNNADEYDFNLLLMPGIIDSVHSGVVSKAIDVCEDRGDCFVIADPVLHGKNITDATGQAGTRNSSYAAMYWPWIQMPDNQLGRDIYVPPSVAMAGVYAFNDKVANPWNAPAGLNRGTIDVAKRTERKLTQTNRDDMYNANLNPIASFPGQGVTVFGQKTLQKKASALDRVNVRRLMIKVKKFIAASSRFLLFEQNTASTRRKFLDMANPFLEQVQAQSGLNAFRVVMDETNNTPDVIDRNQLYGQLFLQPTKTAEFIVLDFTVQPSGAAFPE